MKKQPNSPSPKSLPSADKSSYHHGDLASALVRAAREILETQGLTKLSLRAAARQAGVSQAAPYHHFTDKEELLASVATQGFVEFDAVMKASMAAKDGRSEDRLKACGVAYVKFATDNPALFRLMFGSTIEHCERYPRLEESGAQSFQTLQDSVEATLKEKHVNGLDAENIKLKALSAWCSVHGLATLLIDGGLDMSAFPGLSIMEITEQVLSANWHP